MEIKLIRSNNGNIWMYIENNPVVLNDEEAVELKLALAAMVDEKSAKQVVDVANH